LSQLLSKVTVTSCSFTFSAECDGAIILHGCLVIRGAFKMFTVNNRICICYFITIQFQSPSNKNALVPAFFPKPEEYLILVSWSPI